MVCWVIALVFGGALAIGVAVISFIVGAESDHAVWYDREIQRLMGEHGSARKV